MWVGAYLENLAMGSSCCAALTTGTAPRAGGRSRGLGASGRQRRPSRRSAGFLRATPLRACLASRAVGAEAPIAAILARLRRQSRLLGLRLSLALA